MRIAIIIGTRPEIIKMSPIIRELERQDRDYFVLHTGQHYSRNLDSKLFEQLRIPPAKYNLAVGSGSHAEQIARMLVGIEKILREELPDIVLLEGDTNSVLAGALAASKLQVRLGHIEAGLRCYDRQMPEEINRILTDHCSDYLFAPTEKAKAVLLGEGIPGEKIFVTGNTIVDAVHQNLEIAKEQDSILDSIGLIPKQYFLVTIHRQENVDHLTRFSSVLEGLDMIHREFNMPLIYPIHPRSKKMQEVFKLKPRSVTIIGAVDFLDFLQLESCARLVLTDSGGVQEESCTLGVPCVTLRENTERPESLEVGANVLAGSSPDRILECTRLMLDKEDCWQNPFGNGNAAKSIVEIITNTLRNL